MSAFIAIRVGADALGKPYTDYFMLPSGLSHPVWASTQAQATQFARVADAEAAIAMMRISDASNHYQPSDMRVQEVTQ